MGKRKSASPQSNSFIDFVIPWVDGNDPEWRARKAKYLGTSTNDDSEQRYRDWGLLPYWFRGVEKFAPWVNKVWFICDQEPPEWLNKNHPKLRIVRHEDYLPEEYRPAFSSHPIELNLHRIEGLSEQFVYFNDDTFLLQPVKQEFFFKKGLPRDCALLNAIPTDDLVKDPRGHIFTMFLNNASYINRDYNFRLCLKKNMIKWLHPCYGKDLIRNMMLCTWPRFVGSVEPHLPQAFLKSSFITAWQNDKDILDQTCRHHIRNDLDVNQWLIRLRQIMEGKFIVRKPIRHAAYMLGKHNRQICSLIQDQRHPMICLIDMSMTEDIFISTKQEVQAAFETILSKPSSFEMIE